MSQPMIRVNEVTKSYRRGGEMLTVLDRLKLEMEEGRFYALMGPSGSGKTTLLNLIGGLDTPDSGDLFVAGENLSELAGSDLSHWRAANVGFVFQSFNLLPVLTAFQNVELPLLLTRLSKAEREERVRIALGVVGLEDRMSHFPRQLSGGQQQRVAIARAIVADPTLVLLDEPTGQLDAKSSVEVLALLGRLNSEFGKTILMVTHDANAAQRATRALHLEKGTFVEQAEVGR
jgi:putative ABC transport system ATP-binding protein